MVSVRIVLKNTNYVKFYYQLINKAKKLQFIFLGYVYWLRLFPLTAIFSLSSVKCLSNRFLQKSSQRKSRKADFNINFYLKSIFGRSLCKKIKYIDLCVEVIHSSKFQQAIQLLLKFKMFFVVIFSRLCASSQLWFFLERFF
jgi:hypothetical protein